MNDTEILEDLTEGLSEIKTHIQTSRKDIADLKTGTEKDLTELKTALNSVQDDNAKLKSDLDKVRKQLLAFGPVSPHVRRPGFVSDHCARHLAAVFILGNAKAGRLDLLD